MLMTRIKRLVKIARVKQATKNVYFAEGANISVSAQFEGQNKLGRNSWFDGYMGYGSYIGDECTLLAKVGRYCSIGHRVTVLTGTHPSKTFVSTSPMFYSLARQNGATYASEQKFAEKVFADEGNRYGCIIGNDVWVGYGATIMGGRVVGDGAIVAAGALVTHDGEPYSIVGGVPAKKIEDRFTEDQARWLEDFEWWNKPEPWIKSHSGEFDNIERFINNNGGK